MSKGIIYVMSTVVPGLVKLGKTGSNNFEDRMDSLESNGYRNVTNLQREFAIEVEDYDAKEQLLDDIFSKSKLSNTELYSIDIDIVIQLLSSFEGTQIYPVDKTKEEVFDDAAEEFEDKKNVGFLPDGKYFLERKKKGFGIAKGEAIAKDGVFIVLKGSICGPNYWNRCT